MTMRYSVLNTVNARRLFDPSNKKDLEELKHFMETGHWRGACPFYMEHPWENIPAMCNAKYTAHMLSKM